MYATSFGFIQSLSVRRVYTLTTLLCLFWPLSQLGNDRGPTEKLQSIAGNPIKANPACLVHVRRCVFLRIRRSKAIMHEFQISCLN